MMKAEIRCRLERQEAEMRELRAELREENARTPETRLRIARLEGTLAPNPTPARLGPTGAPPDSALPRLSRADAPFGRLPRSIQTTVAVLVVLATMLATQRIAIWLPPVQP